MPNKSKPQSGPNAQVVARRFWTLLLVILAFAVVASALAVRYTATPFLERQQREVIDGQAYKTARNVETILERHRLLVSLVGNTPDVVNVVMGYADNADEVIGYLEGIQRPDSLSWVTVYDVFGRNLIDFVVRKNETQTLSDEALKDLVEGWVSESSDASKRIAFKSDGNSIHVALAEPILNRGFVEGVIVAGFTLSADEVLLKNNLSQVVQILDPQEAQNLPSDTAVVPLNSINLSIALVPNLSEVAAAGRKLIVRSAIAVAIVLIGAFAIFAALGRAALVEPHKKLEQQKQSLTELAAIAEGANDAIVVTDARGLVTWINPAFEKLSGYTIAEIRNRKPGPLLQGQDTEQAAVDEIRNSIKHKSGTKTEILNYTKCGKPYWISISITSLEDESGKTYGFVAVSSDVTEAREQREAILAANRAIEHQALHDPLTLLPNRRALDLALEARSGTADANATIVRVDLDHFKYINDTMGHAAGDFVLCEVARVLREETKASDLPVRTGGDEFVILLAPELSSLEGQAVAERMLGRIKQPKDFGDKTIRVGASFGVASTRDGLLPLEQLLVGADAALYEAKDLGRNKVRMYTPELHGAVLDRRELAREIRLAIANEEFVPFFQAQFCAKTHEIVGVETLVRWRSPKLGLLFPDVFLPVAQQLSAVDEIDELILHKSMEQISSLEKSGICIPKVSFNVTAERIQNPRLPALVEAISSFGPKISFEILESVLVEEQSDFFNHSLDRLRETGISIEIDDFGSGHASIVGLMHLRPDVMKIDQRLIMPITESDMTRGLLEQIIGMAELMGLRVTAEGVETMEHARILAELGCDTLQGYAFCKAIPIEELEKFIATRAWMPQESRVV